MFSKTPNPNEIIKLLSELKTKTPDYPSDLLAARKADFLNQAVTIRFDGPKQGGKGGGDGGSASGGSGGSGMLGGMTTAQSILLQAVVGVWIIAAMLTSAYIFRDQIIDLLQDNGIVVEMTQAPLIAPSEPAPVATDTELAPTEVLPTGTPEATPISDSAAPNASGVSPDDSSNIQTAPDSTNDNNGLHLGQTPGAPDTPNQDKPDKPDNSNKPEKNK